MSTQDKTIIKPRPAAQAATDRTIIKPRPGGTAIHAGHTVITPRRSALTQHQALKTRLKLRKEPNSQPEQSTRPGQSELMHAASTLFSVLSQLKNLDGSVDIQILHTYVTSLLSTFKQTAQKHINQEDIEKASYALCATMDEAVLNTPWGENSVWTQRPLLSLFHKETYGGEKFYSMLEAECEADVKNYDLIELFHMCLSLGFLGKMRVKADGQITAEAIRAQTYQLLNKHRDKYESALSPHTQALTTKRLRLLSYIPVWLLVAMLILVSYGIYKHWLFDLNTKSDAVITELAALIPQKIEPTLPESDIRKEVIFLRQLLAKEIEKGVLSVDDYTNYSTITLHASELFPSGSAEVVHSFYPVLDKISKALEAIPGRIIVAGHTDNIAIRSAPFPSNWHLSLARASAVGKYMSNAADLKTRLLPEGRGDSEPVADNKTAEGRAKNRRVTISLYYKEHQLMD